MVGLSQSCRRGVFVVTPSILGSCCQPLPLPHEPILDSLGWFPLEFVGEILNCSNGSTASEKIPGGIRRFEPGF